MFEWDIHLFAVRLEDPDTLLYLHLGIRGAFFPPTFAFNNKNTTDLKVEPLLIKNKLETGQVCALPAR